MDKEATTQQLMSDLCAYDPALSDRLKLLLFNDDPSKVLKWHALF